MSVRQIPHSSAEGSGDPLGRVAFRLRIGVTGHRKLSHDLERDLAECVQVQFDRLVERLPAHKSTHIELTVISQLAEGADRFVVHQVLSNAATGGRQARLEAVLPLHRDAYARIQGFDAASREDFDALLEQATAVDEPSPTVDGDSGNAAAAYEAAGRKIIARCDVLLAIWDGHRTGGRGGTAETLLEAASAGKPCVWIPADPAEPVQDNLTRGTSDEFRDLVAGRAAVPPDRTRPPQELPRDVWKPLRDSLDPLQHFNSEPVPAQFDHRLRNEFGYPGGEDHWIAPYFLRATMLAAKNQARFNWYSRAITLLAIAAAVMLGVHLSLSSNPVWDWTEVASLAALTVVFLVLHQRGFHRRWVSYRFLAERLRSARFLIPAGVEFQWAEALVAVYIERNSSDWLMRAFHDLLPSERQLRRVRTRVADTDVLKRRLADDWIGKQIAYHSQRSRHHMTWNRVLSVTIIALFVGTVVCAVLDASAIARDTMGFLSVVFPVSGASLGALLTVRQHRELSERDEKMATDLAAAQKTIRDADNRRALRDAGAQAARIMAEESDDWLGALWFLDVEHPS